MADKRMFSKKITDSDAFLDMPLSSQCLYFHLSMAADDDGFVNNSKKIMRTIGANDDDLKLLLAKSFLIAFENGVFVIKHWWLNNYIRSDRKVATSYQDLLGELEQKDNGVYTLKGDVYQNATKTLPSIDKNRLDKNSIDKSIKHRHGEYNHILLTDEQYKSLLNDLGEKKLNEYIQRVDDYVQMKGKTYKDYNLVIRNWFKKDGGSVKEKNNEDDPYNPNI